MTDTQFDDYLKANSQLSERTVKAYNNQFSKFDGMKKNVVTQSQANIISYIDELTDSENTRLAVLNVAISMRKHYNKDVNKMLNRKLQLNDDYQIKKNVKKEENKADLPSSKELIAWENRQYIDGWYTDYYMDDGGRIIVFVKKMKTKTKKNCCCLVGLDCILQYKTENEKLENI